jgi:hypothetical protein
MYRPPNKSFCYAPPQAGAHWMRLPWQTQSFAILCRTAPRHSFYRMRNSHTSHNKLAYLAPRSHWIVTQSATDRRRRSASLWTYNRRLFATVCDKSQLERIGKVGTFSSFPTRPRRVSVWSVGIIVRGTKDSIVRSLVSIAMHPDPSSNNIGHLFQGTTIPFTQAPN